MDLLDSIRDNLVNQSADIADTLRMATVLAEEYQSPVLREWAESELNEYPEFALVPKYRRVRISLAGTFRDPAGHTMPGVGISAARLPKEVRESINNLYIHDSVAALEEALASGHDVFHRVLPVEVVTWLRECNQMAGDMELVDAYQQISRYLLINILDNVRNRLLRFVLEMKERQVASDGGRSNDIGPEVARNAVNVNIYGDNNVVAAGENIQQEITPVQQGDLDSLVAYLRAHQVPDEDIQELTNAILLEPSAVSGEPGPSVNAWIGGMMSKAASGAWRVFLEQAPTLLVNAIKTYYGV